MAEHRKNYVIRELAPLSERFSVGTTDLQPTLSSGEYFDLFTAGDADFKRGLRTAQLGLRSGTLFREADKVQAAGDDEGSEIIWQRARQAEADAAHTSQRVPSFSQVQGVGDAVDYLQGGLGTLTPTMLPPLAAGVGGALAGAGLAAAAPVAIPLGLAAGIGGAVAASVPAFQMEAGEQASSQASDPWIMANTTAAERLREQNIKGIQNAALELIVPTMVGGRLVTTAARLGRKLVGDEVQDTIRRQALGRLEPTRQTGRETAEFLQRELGARPAADRLRRTAAFGRETASEATTEGLQTLTGQASLSRMNPNRDTTHDYIELIDSIILGALGGGAISGVTTAPGYLAERGAAAFRNRGRQAGAPEGAELPDEGLGPTPGSLPSPPGSPPPGSVPVSDLEREFQVGEYPDGDQELGERLRTNGNLRGFGRRLNQLNLSPEMQALLDEYRAARAPAERKRARNSMIQLAELEEYLGSSSEPPGPPGPAGSSFEQQDLPFESSQGPEGSIADEDIHPAGFYPEAAPNQPALPGFEDSAQFIPETDEAALARRAYEDLPAPGVSDEATILGYLKNVTNPNLTITEQDRRENRGKSDNQIRAAMRQRLYQNAVEFIDRHYPHLRKELALERRTLQEELAQQNQTPLAPKPIGTKRWFDKAANDPEARLAEIMKEAEREFGTGNIVEDDSGALGANEEALELETELRSGRRVLTPVSGGIVRGQSAPLFNDEKFIAPFLAKLIKEGHVTADAAASYQSQGLGDYIVTKHGVAGTEEVLSADRARQQDPAILQDLQQAKTSIEQHLQRLIENENTKPEALERHMMEMTYLNDPGVSGVNGLRTLLNKYAVLLASPADTVAATAEETAARRAVSDKSSGIERTDVIRAQEQIKYYEAGKKKATVSDLMSLAITGWARFRDTAGVSFKTAVLEQLAAEIARGHIEAIYDPVTKKKVQVWFGSENKTNAQRKAENELFKHLFREESKPSRKLKGKKPPANKEFAAGEEVPARKAEVKRLLARIAKLKNRIKAPEETGINKLLARTELLATENSLKEQLERLERALNSPFEQETVEGDMFDSHSAFLDAVDEEVQRIDIDYPQRPQKKKGESEAVYKQRLANYKQELEKYAKRIDRRLLRHVRFADVSTGEIVPLHTKDETRTPKYKIVRGRDEAGNLTSWIEEHEPDLTVLTPAKLKEISDALFEKAKKAVVQQTAKLKAVLANNPRLSAALYISTHALALGPKSEVAQQLFEAYPGISTDLRLTIRAKPAPPEVLAAERAEKRKKELQQKLKDLETRLDSKPEQPDLFGDIRDQYRAIMPRVPSFEEMFKDSRLLSRTSTEIELRISELNLALEKANTEAQLRKVISTTRELINNLSPTETIAFEDLSEATTDLNTGSRVTLVVAEEDVAAAVETEEFKSVIESGATIIASPNEAVHTTLTEAGYRQVVLDGISPLLRNNVWVPAAGSGRARIVHPRQPTVGQQVEQAVNERNQPQQTLPGVPAVSPIAGEVIGSITQAQARNAQFIAMNFRDGTRGLRMRPENRGMSTVDVIKAGRRTATTRHGDKPPYKVGQILRAGGLGQHVFIKVTKEPYQLKWFPEDPQKNQRNAATWSQLEGWTPGNFERLARSGAWQFQFEQVIPEQEQAAGPIPNALARGVRQSGGTLVQDSQGNVFHKTPANNIASPFSGRNTPALNAALTNVTFRQYPVNDVPGLTKPGPNHQHKMSAEAWYQVNKKANGPQNPENRSIMQRIIEAKLRQYPELVEQVTAKGGRSWLETTHHTVNGGVWEGLGMESPFLQVLADAYEAVAGPQTQQAAFFPQTNAADLAQTAQDSAKQLLSNYGFVFQNAEGAPDISVLHELYSSFPQWQDIEYQAETNVAAKVLSDKGEQFIKDAALALSFVMYQELGISDRNIVQRKYVTRMLEEWLSTGKRPAQRTLWPKIKTVLIRLGRLFKNSRNIGNVVKQAAHLRPKDIAGLAALAHLKIKNYKDWSVAVNEAMDKILASPQNFSFQPEKGKKQITFQQVMDKNPVIGRVFKTLNDHKIKFALTGSMAYADQTAIYRNPNAKTHDIDLLFENMGDVEKAVTFLEGTFGAKGALIYAVGKEFKRKDGKEIHGWVFPENPGERITNFKKFRPKFTAQGWQHGRSWDVVDADGNIVGSYKLDFNAQGEMVETQKGEWGVVIDFIANNEPRTYAKQKYTTVINQKEVQGTVAVSNYIDGFRAKFEHFRLKDMRDLQGATPVSRAIEVARSIEESKRLPIVPLPKSELQQAAFFPKDLANDFAEDVAIRDLDDLADKTLNKPRFARWLPPRYQRQGSAIEIALDLALKIPLMFQGKSLAPSEIKKVIEKNFYKYTYLIDYFKEADLPNTGAQAMFSAVSKRIAINLDIKQSEAELIHTVWHELYHRGIDAEKHNQAAELFFSEQIVEQPGGEVARAMMSSRFTQLGYGHLGFFQQFEEVFNELAGAVRTNNYHTLERRFEIQIANKDKRFIAQRVREMDAFLRKTIGLPARKSYLVTTPIQKAVAKIHALIEADVQRPATATAKQGKLIWALLHELQMADRQGRMSLARFIDERLTAIKNYLEGGSLDLFEAELLASWRHSDSDFAQWMDARVRDLNSLSSPALNRAMGIEISREEHIVHYEKLINERRRILMGEGMSGPEAERQAIEEWGSRDEFIGSKDPQQQDLQPNLQAFEREGEFQNIHEALTDPDVQKKQAKVLEYLTRVLGDQVGVELDTWLESAQAGRSIADYNLREKLIRLAIDVKDPLSLAFHESFHAFIQQLQRTPQGQKVYQRLVELSKAPHVLRQMEKNLAGHGPALEQLKDDNERVTYMYQFWAASQSGGPKFNIQPSAISKFKKLFQMLAKALGFITKEQYAAEIFDAFYQGKVNDPLKLQDKLNEFKNTKVAALVESTWPALEKAVRTAFSSPVTRLKATKNKYLIQIAEAYFREVGTKGEAGLLQRTQQRVSQYFNQYRAILLKHNATKESVATALENLQKGGKYPPNTLEGDIQRFFKSLWNYATKGPGHIMRLEVLEDPKTGEKKYTWKELNPIPNFFPRVWNIETILENEKEFRAAVLAESNGTWNDARIDAFMHELRQNDGVEEIDHARAALIPAFTAVNPRSMDFINDTNAAKFTKFQEKNFDYIMTKYIRQIVHRREHGRTFGSTGQGIENLLKAARVEMEKNKMPALEQEKLMRRVHNDIEALNGSLGTQNWTELKRNLVTIPMTIVNFAVLPLATFTSLVDPLGTYIRTGSMKAAANTFKQGILQIGRDFKKSKSDMQKLAEYLGIVEEEMMMSVLGDTFGSMYMNNTMRKINTQFFKIIGLEQWTRGTRIGALQAAMLFLRDAKRENNAKVLKELGLEAADIQEATDTTLKVRLFDFDNNFNSLSDEAQQEIVQRARRIQNALYRLVDEQILRPSAAVRPTWASDIRFAVFAHLKQFTFTFHNVIVKQVARNAIAAHDGGATLAEVAFKILPLLSYVPAMMAADMIRNLVSGRFDDDEEEYSLGHAFWNAGQRSAILGYGTFALDAAEDMEYSALPINTFLGPIVDSAYDLTRAAVDPDIEFLNAASRLLPFSAATRHWFD